jgi:hypothetical protein
VDVAVDVVAVTWVTRLDVVAMKMPDFLKNLSHVPGETPHVPQETPHHPQGTPHEPQAGGQVPQDLD